MELHIYIALPLLQVATPSPKKIVNWEACSLQQEIFVEIVKAIALRARCEGSLWDAFADAKHEMESACLKFESGVIHLMDDPQIKQTISGEWLESEIFSD